MKESLKTLIKATLKRFSIGITSYENLERLNRSKLELLDRIRKENFDIEFLSKLPAEQVSVILGILKKSKSQLRQDLFVLSELEIKKNGFFVEFGAANGIDLSNTYLLEKEFGWSGIVAEPARCWHNDLRKNRNCHIETHCVWRQSNSVLIFNETEVSELSTIDRYSATDSNKEGREKGKKYEVNTISLLDLLDKYDAPKEIDYISIDTEGSEFEIISSFDFERYRFKVITCEHNFTPAREKIHDLLTSQGYVRKFEDISLFDDWYVKA